MKLREIITESSNTNLLVVDVQPEYASYADRILPGVRNMILKSNARVVVIYNNFGGGDSEQDVFNYIAGLDENDYYDDETGDYIDRQPSVIKQKLHRAEFIEKEYGFLRDFMDSGVDDSITIEVIRAMYMQRQTDSRELDLTKLSEPAQQVIEQDMGNIWVQNWVPIAFLKQLSPFYLLGGGRSECLREIELLCNAFNIRFKRLDQLVYG